MARKIFYWIAKMFFLTVFKLYNRLEIRGLEKAPRGTAVIVASNHSSNIDPPLIGGVFPGRLRYLGKESLFSNPLFGFLISALGAVSVTRENSQKAGAVLKLMIKMLREGESILLFPEGTRSADGKLQPLEGGVALLCVKSGVPLLPVYIHGSHKVMPPNKILPRPAKVTVTFGDQIFPDMSEKDEKTRREKVKRALAEALSALEKEAESHDRLSLKA
jgi:1-acyl-sn-glycerol-3-phosphate acyltransferase